MSACLKFTIIVGVFFLWGCGKQSEPENPDAARGRTSGSEPKVTLSVEQQRQAGIVIEQVGRKTMQQSLTTPGRVDFDQTRRAHLTARVPGRVEQVYAYLGDRVKANQLLATVYSQVYLSTQSEYLQADQRLVHIALPRDSVELKTQRGIFESARRKLLVEGGREEDIEELARTHVIKTLMEIRAPFDGVVTEANEILGHYVDVGAPLFHLADLSSVWIIVDIYEKDLSKVRIGMTATAEVVAYPGEQFTGQLTRVFDVVDEKTRTVKGRVELRNRNGKLKPEMFATVTVSTGTPANSIVVPSGAVEMMQGASNVVFVALDDSSFVKRPVKVGRSFGNAVEILEGLSVGESIVTDGAFTIKSEFGKSSMGEE